MAAILGAVGFPLILAYVLVATDMRTDLSGLKPLERAEGQQTNLIGWPDLDPLNGSLTSTGPAHKYLHSQIRMLGYMMDGYTPSPDGAKVEMFILMPEAGHFLHPAHRMHDEMVEVWPTRRAAFQYRRLVWVTGMLERTPGRRDSGRAAYAIKDASIEMAGEREIARWFRP